MQNKIHLQRLPRKLCKSLLQEYHQLDRLCLSNKFLIYFHSYEHVGEVVVEVEKHKSCQCGCKIKAHVNIFCPRTLYWTNSERPNIDQAYP